MLEASSPASSREMLISAIKSQDHEQVKHLLESDDVCLNSDDVIPLFAACKYNNVEGIKLLLKHGVDVNGQVLPADLRYPNIRPSKRKRAIHYACNGEGDRIELVKYLIDTGCDIDHQDDHGYTALHYACMRESAPLMKFLIESGADVRIDDMEYQTPLVIASSRKNAELIKILLDAGSDPSTLCMASIHYCLQGDCHKGVEYLYKASTDLVCDEDGQHPRLRHISRRTDRLDENVRFDTSGREPWLPPLLIACSSPISDPWKTVHTLLDLGADINEKDPSGFNSLQHACSRANVKCVRVLLDYGVNPIDHSWDKLWKVFPSFDNRIDNSYFRMKKVTTIQDYLLMLKILASAGFKIDQESAKVFTEAVKASSFSVEDKRCFSSFLTDYRTVPMSLKELCRIKIRCCLVPHVDFNIGSLDSRLPQILLNFLRFWDFLEQLD